MNALNRRISRLESQFAPRVEHEWRDEHGRTIAEAIFENRRRWEGLLPEEKRQPAAPLNLERRPESIAEAIWRARAAHMNQAKMEAGQE